MEKEFSQQFNRYFIEKDIGQLPKKSGVYGVYSYFYSKKDDKNYLRELIYIGKADDINDRVEKHEKWKIWRSYLKENEFLCFNYTLVSTIYNERVEATLIYVNKPPVNVEYKNAFPFDKTTVKCTGKHYGIASVNIVEKTNE